MSMKSLTFPFPLALAFPALILASCVQSDSAYSLNPDGSGKVVHQIKMTKQAGNWTDEDPARTFALGFIRGTRGVDAWDDVHYRMTDRGEAVEFRGTAYFRDINEVSLGSFLKDVDAAKTSTRMEVTVNGVPVQREDGDEADEDTQGSLDSLMAASFALSGDFKTTIQVNGNATEAHGFTIAGDEKAVTFHHDPDGGGKEGRLQFEQNYEEVFGEKPDKETFDELFANGIFENEKLQKVLTGEAPPFTATFEIEGEILNYDLEVATAEFKLTREEAAGWKKLKSLDP